MPKVKEVHKVNGQAGKPSGKQLRKWRIQSSCGEDKAQMLFSQSSGQEVVLKANPSKFVTITEKGIDPFKKTTCPFCLSFSQLRTFLISTKKGFDRGKGSCPICGLGMQLQTLVKMEKWTAKEYAEFVFNYRTSGFWQKIQPFFQTWKKHLSMMGWTKEFWDEYKKRRDGVDLPDAETQRSYENAYAAYEESFQ